MDSSNELFIKNATEIVLNNEQVQKLLSLLEMMSTRIEYLCALGKFAILIAVIIGIYWLFGKVFFKGV